MIYMKRLAIAISAGTVAIASYAADLPALKQQLDSTARPLGTGTCATQRTGIWLVEGGVVVEIQKPRPGSCLFESLDLIIDGERIPLTAADGNFYRGKKWFNGMPAYVYEWTSGSGKLFFRTGRTIDLEKVQGIFEVGCTTSNCLNEAAAPGSKPL